MEDEYFLNGVFQHLEQMESARNGIEKLRPPADSSNLQNHHITYLINIMSLLELIKEQYGESAENEVKSKLTALGQNADDILGYTRELRNSVVHRGMDLTARGTVMNGIVRVIAPNEVTDRNGKKKYKPHARLLVEVLDDLVGGIKASARIILEPNIAAFSTRSGDELLDMHRQRVAAEPDMPEWVKEISLRTTTAEILVKAVSFRASKLRALLQQ